MWFDFIQTNWPAYFFVFDEPRTGLLEHVHHGHVSTTQYCRGLLPILCTCCLAMHNTGSSPRQHTKHTQYSALWLFNMLGTLASILRSSVHSNSFFLTVSCSIALACWTYKQLGRSWYVNKSSGNMGIQRETRRTSNHVQQCQTCRAKLLNHYPVTFFLQIRLVRLYFQAECCTIFCVVYSHSLLLGTIVMEVHIQLQSVVHTGLAANLLTGWLYGYLARSLVPSYSVFSVWRTVCSVPGWLVGICICVWTQAQAQLVPS